MGSDLRNWIGFFLLGSINNLPYVIVTSAANTIADSFDQRNNVGVVFFANVALSVIVKSLAGLQALASQFLSAAEFSVFVGASAAFGENVALGYLRLFPSKFVNAWSSGTGMAGVLGSTIYIIFGCAVGAGGDNTAKLKNLTKYAFLLTSPVVVVYLLAYFWIIQIPPESESLTKDDSDIQKEKQRLLDSEDGELDEISESVEPVEESALKRILRCFKLVSWVSLNLAAVYMFEYVAQGSAAKVRPKTEYNKGCPELYASLSLCYHKYTELNNKGPELYASLELCINIAALFITVGIVSGTAVETLLFQTALKND
ncbi:battenin [Mytilus galloprovincialis]|uniref:Battenin n=1 Tax=Mytilus galloprovincialis TaxID=29158 RepID=A0A8B6C6S3_MYTGA|nr:battenin [Mytilus galloprovincialis]